jgi:short-subunit dehydrogenase
MKVVVITGISSGIGHATAESFLAQGYTVIGSVRDPQSATDLKAKYADKLILWKCNLLNLSEIDSIHSILSENKIMQVDLLVNNAGIASAAPIQFQEFSEIQNIMTTNVLAVMRLTQIMISYLIPTKGRIINISSISGVSGTPFLGIYCASKHAIEGFSESLRREMKIYDIKVSVIGPGSIKTPIWSKGFEIIRTRFDKTIYRESFHRFIDFAKYEEENALPVSAVVENIMHAGTSACPKIRYSPVPRKLTSVYLPWLLPKSIVDSMTCKALGLRIKKD